MFKTDDPYKFVKHLKSLNTIRVFVYSDVISLCSLNLFSILLKKELIKHEIIFLDNLEDVNFESEYIFIIPKQFDCLKKQTKQENVNFYNLLNNEKRIIFEREDCLCEYNKLDILYNMFTILKKLDYINENGLWSLIIGFSHYKIYLHEFTEQTDSSEEEYKINNNICQSCQEMYNTICIEIKNLDYKNTSEITNEINLSFPLLSHSCLYLSLQNDIFFISKQKVYKKRKDLEEKRIKIFLAKKGVSFLKSKEKFINLDHSLKKYIFTHFEKRRLFYRKRGHITKMSSLDCFLLMSLCILKKESIKAYLLLDDFKSSIDQSLILQTYEVLHELRQSIANMVKSKDILFFKLKSSNISNIEYFIKFAYDIINIYKTIRLPGYSQIVFIEHIKDNTIILYGKDVLFNNTKIDGFAVYSRKTFISLLNEYLSK